MQRTIFLFKPHRLIFFESQNEKNSNSSSFEKYYTSAEDYIRKANLNCHNLDDSNKIDNLMSQIEKIIVPEGEKLDESTVKIISDLKNFFEQKLHDDKKLPAIANELFALLEKDLTPENIKKIKSIIEEYRYNQESKPSTEGLIEKIVRSLEIFSIKKDILLLVNKDESKDQATFNELKLFLIFNQLDDVYSLKYLYALLQAIIKSDLTPRQIKGLKEILKEPIKKSSNEIINDLITYLSYIAGYEISRKLEKYIKKNTKQPVIENKISKKSMPKEEKEKEAKKEEENIYQNFKEELETMDPEQLIALRNNFNSLKEKINTKISDLRMQYMKEGNIGGMVEMDFLAKNKEKFNKEVQNIYFQHSSDIQQLGLNKIDELISLQNRSYFPIDKIDEIFNEVFKEKKLN